MKNQYFGDINDYRKYGLLRVLVLEARLRCLVGWMLTSDDERTDGRFIEYLGSPSKWRHFDPELFDVLRDAVIERGSRHVTTFENSDLLPQGSFFPENVPDLLLDRDRWFERLLATSSGHDLVFLDPDNGIEVKSTPKGTKGSSKYVYWSELAALYEQGASLLVYQHFPRRPRRAFTASQACRLAQEVGVDRVLAFSTSNVLFLLAPQSKHESLLLSPAQAVAQAWNGQIDVSWEQAD